MMKKFLASLAALAVSFIPFSGNATLVTLPSPVYWPGLSTWGAVSSPGVQNSATLDAAGKYQAYIYTAKENMVISHVTFRTSAPVTGSPTVTATIEAVDTGGLPAGSAAFGSSAGTSGTVTANSNTLVALGASATVPAGTDFAVKIAYNTGTTVTLQQGTGAAPGGVVSTKPYSVTNTGTPTRGLFPAYVMYGVGSSATTWYQLPNSIPVSGVSGGTFNNTSSARRGLRFTLPFNCRIIGIRWYNANATGNFNATLFDDGGSLLESTAFEGDANAVSNNGVYTSFFDTPITGTAGVTYRAAIEPTTTTNVNVSTYVLVSASYVGASPIGTYGHYTTYTGTWDDTATGTMPMMDIIIDQIDNGTGSGSAGGNSIIGVQ